jgi:hypothetical protein
MTTSSWDYNLQCLKTMCAQVFLDYTELGFEILCKFLFGGTIDEEMKSHYKVSQNLEKNTLQLTTQGDYDDALQFFWLLPITDFQRLEHDEVQGFRSMFSSVYGEVQHEININVRNNSSGKLPTVEFLNKVAKTDKRVIKIRYS